MKDKKGFTLVELLAVIVMLGIILIIAVPKITDTIDNAKLSAFIDTTKMIATSAETEYTKRSILGTLDQENDEITCEDATTIASEIYTSCVVEFNNNIATVTIVGIGKYDGYNCIGTKDGVSCIVSDESVSQYSESEGVNIPQLATGMTPIKWNGSAWIETTSSDSEWYDYTNKEWANAITEDGSMWVWIPRYIYKISTNWHTTSAGTIEVQFTQDTNDNWNSGVIGNIETGLTSNTSNNTWTNHPAFTFGETELLGIWVAKFEATASEGLSNSSTLDDVTTKTIKIIPNIQSWRYINLNNMFIVSRNMETDTTYGWDNSGSGIDTHLIKNTEWGAVAYLSKSSYGQTTEIWINNSSTYITGCAGSSVDAGDVSGCTNSYETVNGMKASTTGTIYGIYDMSGGAYEKVAAYIDNSNSVLTTNAASLVSADAKYKNVYPNGSPEDQGTNYALMINYKGDAMYETGNGYNAGYGWYSDWVVVPCNSTPLFNRGGISNISLLAGIYSFTQAAGSAGSGASFRPVILVQSGL